MEHVDGLRTTGQVLTAWIGEEELRAVFALARTDLSRTQITARLYRFYD
ncbi:MAG: hypothetical protein ABIQ09_13795 [Jatrophihabitantaceae bacterium]